MSCSILDHLVPMIRKSFKNKAIQKNIYKVSDADREKNEEFFEKTRKQRIDEFCDKYGVDPETGDEVAGEKPSVVVKYLQESDPRETGFLKKSRLSPPQNETLDASDEKEKNIKQVKITEMLRKRKGSCSPETSTAKKTKSNHSS